MAESGNAPVLSFKHQELISDANKATGFLREFRVQIPTLANSQFADKAGFECVEPTKQNISKKAVNGCESKSFSRRLEKYAMSVPQSELEELKSVLHHVYVRRFKGKCKTPKYGSINKAFTEPELQRFLRNVKSVKFVLLFKYQAFLGLRVGEVSKLHISNINFDKRELTLKI